MHDVYQKGVSRITPAEYKLFRDMHYRKPNPLPPPQSRKRARSRSRSTSPKKKPKTEQQLVVLQPVRKTIKRAKKHMIALTRNVINSYIGGIRGFGKRGV